MKLIQYGLEIRGRRFRVERCRMPLFGGGGDYECHLPMKIKFEADIIVDITNDQIIKNRYVRIIIIDEFLKEPLYEVHHKTYTSYELVKA